MRFGIELPTRLRVRGAFFTHCHNAAKSLANTALQASGLASAGCPGSAKA
jgi:hypothetical protein